MVTVLDGVGEFTVGGVKHVCKAGEALVMPEPFLMQFMR